MARARAFTVAIAIVSIVTQSAAAFASDRRPAVDPRKALAEGSRVGVDLEDGRRIIGTVSHAALQDDGVYLTPATGPAPFVRYRDMRALVDPDSGALIAALRSPRGAWVTPAIAAVTALGLAALFTGGKIPLCFFFRCD